MTSTQVPVMSTATSTAAPTHCHRCARRLVHCAHRRISEELFLLAGDLESMNDIGSRVVLRERQQVIARGDPLGQLSELFLVEQSDQLRLADEDDLQKLPGWSFEICQQPDLLQNIGSEVLRLINDEHRATPLRMRIEQVSIERVDEELPAGRAGGIRDAEFVAQRGEQLDIREPRIEEDRK